MTSGKSDLAPSDSALLQEARSDPEALAAFYRRYVRRTVRFSVRRCARPEEVHDLVAAIWLEVIEALPRFDPAKGSASAWLFGIASNLVADSRRRAAREGEAMRRLAGQRVLDADDVRRLEESIDAERITPGVVAALAHVPPAERAALELVMLDRFSQKEAATVLGVSDAVFRMRLARARERLRRHIPELGGNDEVALEAKKR